MANRVNKKAKKNYLFILLLFLATIFMAVGYASINGVFLDISGRATVLTQNIIHITSATYSSDNGADVTNSTINDFFQTTLNSSVTLGSSTSSTITYEITVLNDSNNNYAFTGTSFSAPDFYDNTNITFDLNGISVGDEINAGLSKTFTITFRYTGNDTSNPVLNSYISFDFSKYYTITYVTAGTNNANNPTKYFENQTVTFLNPTNGSKTFQGWYRNQSYTGNPITNTSGLNENLTLYAKWFSGYGDTATTYVAGLTNGAPLNSENIITVTSNDNTCTNTFAYDLTTDNNLRYIGSNPCNYVKFNCDSNNNCELWRIIGVMNGVDTDPVLKIIKSTTSASGLAWNSTNSNNWETASLNSYLNNDYIATLNAGVIDDYVLSAKWRIGGVTAGNTAKTIYPEESATLSSNAYVGIFNPSDYAFATSGTNDSTRSTCITSSLTGNNINATCYGNNYLAPTNADFQWTINKRINGNSQAIRISDVGKTVNTQVRTAYNYKPVVYLLPNVKIKKTSANGEATGNGSQNSPYELIPGD